MYADNLKRLLEVELDADRVKIVNDDVMCCCLNPSHNERNPSFGIKVDSLVFNCFTCGYSGTLVSLIMDVKGWSFKRACHLVEKYGGRLENGKIKRREKKRKRERELPSHFSLAPLRSGKIYTSYLKDRGILKESCKEFKIGWDEDSLRITFPVFGRTDDILHGFIRRAILPDKIKGEDNPDYVRVYGRNPKYLIDPTIQKSEIIYPWNLFESGNDKSAIIVEGCIDCIMMRQNGFVNTVSIINSKMNKPQVAILKDLGIKTIISFLDNDVAGEEGLKNLIDLCYRDFIIYNHGSYPEGKNDPGELTRKEVQKMLKNMQKVTRKSLTFKSHHSKMKHVKESHI